MPSERKDTPQWHNFVAGGVAGAGSRLATAPLDLIRIRRQLQATTVVYPSESLWQSWKKIVQTEKGGVWALYRGNTAAICLWISYAAVQFAVYTPVRQAWQSQAGAAFGAGAIAGVCATLATYPFDVCRTTFAARGLQSEPSIPTTPPPMAHHSMIEPTYPVRSNQTTAPTSIAQFAMQLWKAKGWRGFYAGAGPATAQIIPYMGLNFGLYDIFVHHDGSFRFSSATAGALSGAISKIIIYPVDTVKRRLQAQAFFDERLVQSKESSSRVWSTVVDLYQQGGWRSFYRGVFPSLLKTTIATSLSFSLFRTTKDALDQLHVSTPYRDNGSL